jgi:hypothetical protein
MATDLILSYSVGLFVGVIKTDATCSRQSTDPWRNTRRSTAARKWAQDRKIIIASKTTFLKRFFGFRNNFSQSKVVSLASNLADQVPVFMSPPSKFLNDTVIAPGNGFPFHRLPQVRRATLEVFDPPTTQGSNMKYTELIL